MIARMRSLISNEETALLPDGAFVRGMARVKNIFRGNVPRGVWAYFPCTVLLIVEACTSSASAACCMVKGARLPSGDVKNRNCFSTRKTPNLCSVIPRCSMLCKNASASLRFSSRYVRAWARKALVVQHCQIFGVQTDAGSDGAGHFDGEIAARTTNDDIGNDIAGIGPLPKRSAGTGIHVGDDPAKKTCFLRRDAKRP